MIVEKSFDEPSDRFPVGMRVLAVDDDPICLRLLETLLRKCHYHVTTTSQAIVALKLLRENKNKFDLVISDVHMPDMDGFRLLELVGLEMDLPVIMLSANGDPKLVMKGITHGACDYLLKPVRIEELKNIWQHVVRRKKFDSKDQNNSDKPHHESEGDQVLTMMGDSDQNDKMNRKRKEQNEDEDEDCVDNGHNNEDPSTQKKPRVVWTVDLHRKFVAAVNQLGIDKAVPKRILDMMNVDKLTRENVASHLQKYRLYLKRISCVANQQNNMVAALGGADSAYLRMGSLNGYGNFQNMASSAQIQNVAVRSFSSSGMLGRLNSPAGLGMLGLSSTGMVQLGHSEDLSNPINNQSKFHQDILPGNQNGNILQGMPTSFDFDQLQLNKGVDLIGDLSTASTNDSMIFPISSGFSDGNVNGSSPNNSHDALHFNPMILQRQSQEIERNGVHGNQSCVTLVSSTEFSSRVPDFARITDGWPIIQTSEIQSNSSTLSDCFKQATPSYFRNNMSLVAMDTVRESHDISSISSVPTGFPDLRTDLQCQAAPKLSSGAEKNMNYITKQGWENNKSVPSHSSNLMYNSMNYVIPSHGVLGPFIQRVDPNNTVHDRDNSLNMVGQRNLVDPLIIQHSEVEQSGIGTTVKLKQGYLVDERKPQDDYLYNNVGSLEDLVSATMKQDPLFVCQAVVITKEQDNLTTKEGDFGYNTHSLGTCT